MTIEDALFRIAEKYPWTATWLRTGHVILAVAGRAREARSVDEQCPAGVEALGCTGTDSQGRLAWIGWDFDVGHGKHACPSTDAAIAAARRLRNALHGRAEIRFSKSGIGIHVRHLWPNDRRPGALGQKIAKQYAEKLQIPVDLAPLGRQAVWFWARVRPPHSFELIEAHEGL